MNADNARIYLRNSIIVIICSAISVVEVSLVTGTAWARFPVGAQIQLLYRDHGPHQITPVKQQINRQLKTD